MTPRRLVLDLQATQSPAHGDRGIARYVREHARALLERDGVARLVLSPALPFPRRLDLDLLTSPLLTWNTRSNLRATLEAEEPLAYHVMSPFEISAMAETDLPPHLLVAGLPLVATLYDLIPLVLADTYLVEPTLARRYRARAELLHQADLVLTISEHTRRDAVDHLGLLPSRVVAIGAGVAPFFSPPPPADDSSALLARHLPGLAGPFVLNVSGGDPRKGTERLLDAWAALAPATRAAHQLVVSCSLDPGTRRTWTAHREAAGLTPEEVLFTGWVPDEVLRALYRRAELFVFPSRYEGYGLPAAEAIACGCPVLTSATTSLPEVLDWPPSTFDPEDAGAIAAAVERGLADESFRSELQARGAARRPALTWGAVAERTVEAVGRLDPPRKGRAHVPRRRTWRVALVGPQPPIASGIAEYNGHLVPELAARAVVDLFTEAPRPPEGAGPAGVGWFPTAALGRTVSPWSYDAVVYTVGNSDHHHDLYELASEFPGLLWMHDVRLPGLFVTYTQERVPERHKASFLVARLEQQYRRRLPPTLDQDFRTAAPPDYVDSGIGLSRELVDVARGVVVSTEVAGRLLALDQPPDARIPPLTVVPHAVPPPVAGRRRSGGRDGTAVVTSFGMVAPVKAPDVVVAAFAELVREQGLDATLVLAGPAPDDVAAPVRAGAAALGVAERVVLTGALSREDYDAELARATVAVQLRTSTNGEASGAVHECIANGIPVLTNVAGAEELPEGVVGLVPPGVGAPELADRLAALLADADGAATAMAAAQAAYAAGWGFGEVAERIIGVVAGLGPTHAART